MAQNGSVTASGVPAGTAPTPAPASAAASPTTKNTVTNPNSGLWIGVAMGVGILSSGTSAAPLVCGILVVGCIYQLQNLLQGK